jgi:DNA (cytosine-5)-methyltransferase 1
MSCGFAAHPAFRARFAVDGEFGKPSSGPGSLGCNATYERNIGIPVRAADLSSYPPDQLLRESGLRPGETDVLISCAPCTGFSRMQNRNHSEDDPRNRLVVRTADFVDALRPKIFIMENARELVRGAFSSHLLALAERLDRLGYSALSGIHMLSDYGLPQIRERAVVVGMQDRGRVRTLEDLWHGYGVDPEAITVRRAISRLPRIDAGEQHPSDPMHVSPAFSNPLSLRRMRAIPRDGGSWCDLVSHPEAEALMTPAMKAIAARRDWGSHPDVYGRLWWDKPCVTIKRECAHVGNGRYAHPEQDRLCTVRELGLLNGFPDEYEFLGTLSNRYRHIGDAVPPLIAYQLAHVCHWMLTDRQPTPQDCVLPGTSLRREDIRPVPTALRLFA